MNYKKGNIYKLVSNNHENIYIGSTTKKLSMRMSNHKHDHKRWKEGTFHYISSFDVMKHGDNDIILLENFEYDSLDKLHKRERHYIETLDCVNKSIPTRTKKEWEEANKEKRRKQKKKWIKNNKEKIAEHSKKYRDKKKKEKMISDTEAIS